MEAREGSWTPQSKPRDRNRGMGRSWLVHCRTNNECIRCDELIVLSTCRSCLSIGSRNKEACLLSKTQSKTQRDNLIIHEIEAAG